MTADLVLSSPDDIVEIFKVLQTKLCEPPCLTLLEAVVDALPAGDHSDRFIDAIIHSSKLLPSRRVSVVANSLRF